MFRNRLIATALATVFGATLLMSTGASAAKVESSAACAMTIPADTDTQLRWRLEAYTQLDCIVDTIDRAMQDADDEEITVTLKRSQLDDIRARAFMAKDAAARIGR